MPLSSGSPSGSSGCVRHASSSRTKRRARPSGRRRRPTAAARPGGWFPRPSSSSSAPSASCRRWRWCCATSSADSSTSPRCATAARCTSAGSRARVRSSSGTTSMPGMAGASRSELPRRAAVGVLGTWRRLNFEQRVAGVAALLLIVSTFGPFSFVEAAIVVTGLAVLLLLRKRAEGREFHIPFGDGTVIAAAGAWSGVLIVIRLFDRPLGQNLLALVCAALLVIAGLAERRKRPPDDLPGPNPEAAQRGPDAVEWEEPTQRMPRRRRGARPDTETEPLGQPRPRVGASDAETRENPQMELRPESEPLPPPEFRLPPDD